MQQFEIDGVDMYVDLTEAGVLTLTLSSEKFGIKALTLSVDMHEEGVLSMAHSLCCHLAELAMVAVQLLIVTDEESSRAVEKLAEEVKQLKILRDNLEKL